MIIYFSVLQILICNQTWVGMIFGKKTNRLTDNRDSEPVKSSKKPSIDENLLTQSVEELVYPGNCNMIIVQY